MTARAYCYREDGGIPHGMQDVTEIEDREPVFTTGGNRIYTWQKFGCGCIRPVEQAGGKS